MGRRTDAQIAAFLITTWGVDRDGLDGSAVAERLVRDEGWRLERAMRAVARLESSGPLGTGDDGRIVVASSPCLLSGHDDDGA